MINFFDHMNKNIVRLFKKLMVGLILIIIGFQFWIYLTGNVYNEFLLLIKGKKTTGYIYYSEEFKDIVEQERRSDTYVWEVKYKYYFNTLEGKRILGKSETVSSEPGLYESANKKPIKIEVIYLPKIPSINRNTNDTNQSSTIIEFIFRKILIGGALLLFFLSIGFNEIRNSIKEYKSNYPNI